MHTATEKLRLARSACLGTRSTPANRQCRTWARRYSPSKTSVNALMLRLCPALCLLLLASPALADSVADFYRGKTMNALVGVKVVGCYDFEERLLARFMRAHIPGNPVLVPQNMIGAGGIKMANFLSSIAPQDGTAIGMFPHTLIAVQAVGTWHTTGVKTIEDARRRDLTVAAANKGAITYTFPRMLNEFLGTRLKI